MKNILLLLITNGLCQLIMAQKYANVPSVQIVSIKAGNNQKDSSFVKINVPQKGQVKLAYDQNYLQFSFIDTQRPANKSFSYKLYGLDYSWITCTDCSQVVYAHLDGGDYTFQVKTTQVDAVPAQFNFTIEGNIWHKWWFVPMLVLYGLVLIGVAIYVIVLFQFRQKLIQQRLVHKEKMTSLTELTSGIAHELQNPLNFVNNFSDLSIDMIEELLTGPFQKLPQDEKEYADEILNDLTQNLKKITHHGGRASAIVKGMLEHSRTSSGERQPIDLNRLADDSLKRAYQFLQVKDKDGSTAQFNCQLVTDFDSRVGAVNVVAQDIGRVLINLINNAFYAVSEKRKQHPDDYQPLVSIRTHRQNGHVEIHVSDNGAGISEAVKAKIFQPFFTTKPTGEGTGLGLSLAYDIVTKGHSGTLTVESKEGEGTKFVISLPA